MRWVAVLALAVVVVGAEVLIHRPTSEPVIAPHPDYTLSQLADWYRLLRDPAGAIDGVWGSAVNADNLTLSYRVLDEKSAKKLKKVATETGVPLDALQIEVSPDVPQLRNS